MPLYAVILYIFVCYSPLLNAAQTGSFDKDFSDVTEAYNAIKKYGNNNFVFTVKKNGSSGPQWTITLQGPYQTIGKYNPFCEIIKGERRARMLQADKKDITSNNTYVTIFSRGDQGSPEKHMDRTKSVVMVIPQKHVLDITELTQQELQNILRKSLTIVNSFKGDPNHYTFETNRGSSSQQVSHLHMHVTINHKSPLPAPLFKQTPYEAWSGNKSP